MSKPIRHNQIGRDLIVIVLYYLFVAINSNSCGVSLSASGKYYISQITSAVNYLGQGSFHNERASVF